MDIMRTISSFPAKRAEKAKQNKGYFEGDYARESELFRAENSWMVREASYGLLTKEMWASIPALYSTENKKPEDTPIAIKLFTPDACATWYITEGDPEEGLLFGFCNLGWDDGAELGYVSVSELEKVKGRLGLPVDVDRFFRATLKDVLDFKKR